MDCPRCGQTAVTQDACPRCGVVFAKLHAPRARPTLRTPAPAQPAGSRALPLALGAITLLALGALAWRGPKPAPSPPEPTAVAAPEPVRSAPGPSASQPKAVPMANALPSSLGLAPEDLALFDGLVERVNAQAPLADPDVRSAEGLYARHPEEEAVRLLLGNVLLVTAAHEARSRKLDAALVRLSRARGLLPGNREPLRALLQVQLDSGDWAGAEEAARELLALERTPELLERLAYAFFRQDRNREAAQILRETLELGPSESARSLLARIEKSSADELGMTEQQLSHFHVRYDGDAHEDVGREILRVLERHYATLAGTLDHQPAATIPVILFSRQQYYDASGAPAWSGGVYEPIDGRIRLPIKGLSTTMTPDLERTLIHEVAHAFLADRSRGQCPRDVHEGFAQYMEGKRIAGELPPAQLTALADGRIGGVAGFYLQALSFVEYLQGARGQGGINDLLREMGETRDVDEAYRRVYGSDERAIHQAWLARLRQQHGS